MSETPALTVERVEAAGPLTLAAQWLAEAEAAAATPNPNALSLATVSADGQPACRIVLAKAFDTTAGHVTFYTNYKSRKGQELSESPRYAAVFHWDDAERQLRIEGDVERSPRAVSDAYFESRPWRSRIGAWASEQSRAIDSRDALEAKVRRAAERFDVPDPHGRDEPPGEPSIERPPHWGGYRLWIRRLEFWHGGMGRLHDRIDCQRELRRSGASGWETGPFRIRRLQP